MLPLALSNGDVILIVVFIAFPIAAIAFAGAGAAYRQIGKGAFAMDHDLRPASSTEQVPREVQEAEIRQMLEAKAFRQAERGEAVLDVETEMQRLLAPKLDLDADPALVEEVRQLVVARNERRRRGGKEPLDVEAEVTRQLRDLENLGH